MIGFDLLYGIVSMILNAIAFIALLALFLRLRSGNSEYKTIFIYSIFLKPRRFTIAFLSLFLSSFFLVVGYVISFLISFSAPDTVFWEYTNILTFLSFALFAIFFSGVYKRKKENKSGETGSGTNTTAGTNVDATKNETNQTSTAPPKY